MNKLITEKRDSLIIQPVYIQRAVLRKLPTQNLGMTLETSSSTGVHIIGSIAEESPTEACGNIDIGDEIIQVGHHTVVGWQLNCLVDLLKVTREVILTVKKRPRHNANGPDRNRNNATNTLTKSFRRSRKSSKRRIQSNKTTTNTESATDSLQITDKIQLPTADSNDNVFNCLSPRSLINSPAKNIIVQAAHQVDTKQRRATVSGGSPRPASNPSTPGHDSTTHSDNTLYQSCNITSRDDDLNNEDDQVFNEDDTIVEEDEDKLEKDKNKLNVECKTLKEEVEFSDSEGYEIKIVGGVTIKTKMCSDEIAPLAKIQYRIKSKLHTRDARVESRRISCLLLGRCECKGWLWLRRSLSFLSEPWKKMWFALKDNRLYYYITPEATNASGVLLMPMFTLSPAPEVKGKKKYAFKAYNESRKFYFYSERQNDMSKWMNQLGLAAIDYNRENDNESAFSGSEDETPEIIENISKPKRSDAIFKQLTSSAQRNKRLALPVKKNVVRMRSTEEGKSFRNRAVLSIHDAGLGLDGRNMSTIRMTTLMNANEAIDMLRSSYGSINAKRSSEKLDLHRQLAALMRTKMDMRQELLDIEIVLSRPSRENLFSYQTKYRQ